MPLAFPGGLDQAQPRVQWADWLELWLLFGDDETLSRSAAREALDLHYPEEDLLETTIDEAFSELGFRETALRASYPIRQEETYLKRLRSRQDCIAYSFLLALGTKGFYDETTPGNGEWNVPARLFEYVVTAAIQRYVNGRAIRIGTRRDDPVPLEFDDCLRYLAAQTAEPALRPVNPDIGEGDEKCDVVGWAPFADGRPGQLVVLAQCTIGDRWKRSKLHELDLTVWNKQVDWHAVPVKAFAIPFLAEYDDDEWREICTRGGVHFDRLRLSSLVRDEDLSAPVRDEILQWCNEFAGKLPYAD